MEPPTKTNAPANQQNKEKPKVLVIQRVFGLPVEMVWAALTEPDQFKKWWGPKGFTCPFAKMESRVGGEFLGCMRAPDGKEFWSGGVVKELVTNRKLVVTDYFTDENGNKKPASEYGMPGEWPDELLVSYELEEDDGVTKLRLEHDGIPAEMYLECMKGWNESFDKLGENIR